MLITFFACTQRQVRSGSFEFTNQQAKSGTHIDLWFWSKSRCYAWENRRSGLGPIETSDSDANHIVLLAQNDRWGLGPMETSISSANHAVLYAQSDRWGQGPIENINSCHNVAVVNAQNHRWGLGPIETCNSGDKVAALKAKKTYVSSGTLRDM